MSNVSKPTVAGSLIKNYVVVTLEQNSGMRGHETYAETK